MRKFKKVLLLGLAVAALSMFTASCTFEGEAQVRFTWEHSERQNITHISASYYDMDWWYEEVYKDLANADEDFSEIPLYKGSPMLPDGLLTPQNRNNNPNKGKYFDIAAGRYTAVCGVEDEFGLAEIVANYQIKYSDYDKWYEIAFDVGAFLDGDDDLGWFGDEYDNPRTQERLRKPTVRKAGVKKIEQNGATIDVEFYVIRRPKN